MLNFFKEAMSPSTRSATARSLTAAESGSCSNGGATTMKGYKITDNERTRKFGIGADSLDMLKFKAQQRFPIKDLRVYHSTDGSEISDDDYFRTLESQTLFIIAEPDEIITTDDDHEFEQLRQHSPLLKVADIVYDFIEQHPGKFRAMIADYERRKQRQKRDTDETAYKTQLSLRTEHHEWFDGQEERCHTKEEAMAKRAQDRVRGYYYKTKDELTHSRLYRQNRAARQIFDSVLEKFRYLLIGCDYFSMIFDRNCARKHTSLLKQRSDDEADASVVPNKRLKQIIKEYTTRHEILDEWSVSLCTDLGDFHCQGTYSAGESAFCSLKHTINPYASRENLILFQVWNLDHQIELSRSILPALVENVRELVEQPQRKCALHKQRVVDISVLEYFLEIFSLKNLKLVHIVCHEKVQRANKSNGRLICEQCHEFQIVKELMDVRDPDDVDAYSNLYERGVATD